CMESGVNSHLVGIGAISDNTASQLSDAKSILARLNIWFDDASPQNMLRIASQARRHKRQHNIGLVVVDYLQLIEPEEHNKVREQEVSKISRRLKGLARSLNIPVVALAQLNRAGDAEPTLTHLRESGAIEQDADTVLLLHRPCDTSDVIDVHIAKQRN